MRAFTETMLVGIAGRFRALGEPMRLRVLDALRRKERTVGELVEAVGAHQANVSKHLAVLTREGFLARRKDGLNVYYRVADPSVFELCDTICGGLEHAAAAQFEAFAPRRAAPRKARPGR